MTVVSEWHSLCPQNFFFHLKLFFSFFELFVQGSDTMILYENLSIVPNWMDLYCYRVRSHKGSTGLGSTRSSKTEFLSAMTLFHPHLLFLLLYSALRFSYHCVMLVASPCLAVPSVCPVPKAQVCVCQGGEANFLLIFPPSFLSLFLYVFPLHLPS